MNGRERILKTLRGEQTDRIPVSPFLYYNVVYEMFGYKPDMDNFFDPGDFDPIEKYVEYCDHYGFDLIHPLGSVWDFYAANTSIDKTIARSWDNWDVMIEDQRVGDKKNRILTIKTPEGTLKHIENYNRTSPYLIVSAPAEYLIKTKKDFDIFRKYSPPADFIDTQLVSRAKITVREKGVTSACTLGAFCTVAQVRKLEDLLTDPISDESFYREMMEFFVGIQIKRNNKIVAAGADIIEVGANMATSSVGPQYFEKYVAEYENRLLKAIHTAGALTLYHNCGDANKIMHLYNNLDIDCWGYLTPPPYGDVDLEKALKVIRPNMSLRGNIDQVQFLMIATPKQVKEKVRQLLEKVKSRGNWILSTTDFFFDKTPEANIRAFIEAGLEYGQY